MRHGCQPPLYRGDLGAAAASVGGVAALGGSLARFGRRASAGRHPVYQGSDRWSDDGLPAAARTQLGNSPAARSVRALADSVADVQRHVAVGAPHELARACARRRDPAEERLRVLEREPLF